MTDLQKPIFVLEQRLATMALMKRKKFSSYAVLQGPSYKSRQFKRLQDAIL